VTIKKFALAAFSNHALVIDTTSVGVTFWATGPAKGRKCLVEEDDGTRRSVSLYTEDGSGLIEGKVYRVRKEI